MENAGRLVTNEKLLKAVWPRTYVSEGLLHTYLRDLRHILNDDPEAPRFIETVVRRGYRFIAPLAEEPGADDPKDNATPAAIKRPSVDSLIVILFVHPSLVGREVALSVLQEQLVQALAGQRAEKKTFHAAEQDTAAGRQARAAFQEWDQQQEVEQLIYVDETGSHIDLARTYAWGAPRPAGPCRQAT